MTVDGMQRLGEAMAAWLAFRRDGGDAAGLLASHPHLRDLLEPMLQQGGEPPPAPGIGPGTVLGDFKLLREIGRGGMGIVYAARQLSLDREVAVKLLPPGGALQPRTLLRFKREAATAARLEHPGIVAVHAVGEHQGLHWFAMELIAGEPLDRHAAGARQRDRVGWVRAAVQLVARVATALQAAHDAGIVHRDVKPANVLVRPDGTPVLTDFGLARSGGLPSLSQTGEFAGTPHYVSPEQARGDGDVDARSDVFSLGVTLYELLAQQLPFRGDSTRAVLDGIQRKQPPAPSRIARALPRDLDAVVLKALAKEPAHRYPSAAAFADDLYRFLAGSPVQARPVRPPQRLWRWARREPLRASLLSALLLVALLGAAMWQNRPALARGQQELVADRVEDLLLQATISPLTEAGQQGKTALLAQALALAPDDPYVVALVALRRAARDPAAAVQCLDQFAGGGELPPALRRLRLWLRDDPAADRLPPPQDALDHFLCGNRAMRRWAGGDAEAAKTALEHLRAAVALTSRPRSMYYIGMNQAARALDDWNTVRTAADALVQFWEGSAVSHCHRALAWLGDDYQLVAAEARRSLELAPDNFLGLDLLAKALAELGEGTAAAALHEKAVRLHPDQAAFVASDAAHDPAHRGADEARK